MGAFMYSSMLSFSFTREEWRLFLDSQRRSACRFVFVARKLAKGYRTVEQAVSVNRRPGVVTFIGIILYIQAFVAAAFGIVAFIERNNRELQLVTGQSDSDLIVLAIVEFAFAVVLFLVAAGVMSGASWARMLVAIVAGFRIVVISWWMIAHHAGGFHSAGLVTILIYVFVLWALYANKESEAFYEGAM